MNMNIECPVCEQQFSTVGGAPGKQVSCPNCARTFPLSTAIEIEPPASELDSVSVADHNPRLAVPIELPEKSIPFAKTVPAPESSSNSDSPMELGKPFKAKQVNRKIIRHQLKRRKKNRLITTLASMAVLAIIIGVLVGMLVMRMNKKPATTAGANTDPIDASLEDDSNLATGSSAIPDGQDSKRTRRRQPESKPPNDDPNAVEVPPPVVREPPIRPEDIPPLKLTYLKRSSVDDCWESVWPHLVSLKVTDALGTHAAVGTIIDSRGWILTNYSTIADASKIEVTASAKSIEAFQEHDQLTDLARGIIAVDPANDLAILAINRRFVVAFSFLKISNQNKIPRGDFLVQCAPPSRSNLWGRTESEIMRRGNFSSLGSSGQSAAKQKNLDRTDLTWLVAASQSLPLPGTPLVTIDGTIEAINVSAASGEGYFLPVHRVGALVKSFDGNIKPFKRPAQVADELVAVPDSHPMRKQSVSLNRIGEKCKQFGWIPTNRSQYEDLQQFAEKLDEAASFAEANVQSDDDEDLKIAEQVKLWKNSLVHRFQSLSEQDTHLLNQLNKQFVKDELTKPGRIVPFLGRAFHIQMTNEQLWLEMVDDDIYVNVSFDPTAYEPIRIDSVWLFFVRTAATRSPSTATAPGKGKIRLESAELILPLGPIN